MNILRNWSIRKKTLYILVFTAVLFFIYLAYGVDARDFNWADRDLARAENLFQVFQISGAEYTFTGRTPGGAYYYILGILLLITTDAYLIYLVYLLFLFSVIVCVADWIGRVYSGRVAILFMLVLLGNFIILKNLGLLWNPTIGFPFMLLSLYFSWRMVVGRNGLLFIPAVVFAAIAIQCHLSFVYPLLLTIVASLTSRIERRWTGYLFGVLCVIVVFSPYLVYEFQHDFPIFKEAVSNKTVQKVEIISLPVSLSGLFGEDGAISHRFVVSVESLKYMLSVPFGILFEDIGGELPKGIRGQIVRFGYATMISGGVLIASIVYGFWLMRLRFFRWKSDVMSDGNRLAVFVLLSLITITLLFSWTTVGITPRYMLFTIVCGALFGALSLNFLWELSTTSPNIFGRASFLLFLTWCVVGVLWNIMSASTVLHTTESITSLSTRDSLRKGIEKFVSTRNFKPSGIVVIYGEGQTTRKHATYLIGELNSYFFGDLVKRRFSPAEERRCIAVVADAEGKIAAQRMRISSLIDDKSGLASQIRWGEMQFIGKHFIAAYALPHGNCLDTVRNYWVYTENHKEAFELSGKLGENAVEVAAEGNVRRFIFKFDRIGQYRVILDLVAEEGGFRVILQSYGFQNQYFGLSAMINPMLEFQLADDPNSYRLNLAPDVPVGTVTPGLETPVRSALAPYPWDRLRRIKFLVDKVVGVETVPNSGQIEMVLTKGS